jgi:hypothetical protein
MSIHDILTQHDFPHRFYAYYAAQGAKDALSKAKVVHSASRLAVDVAERFGNGEDFTQEYLKEVADAASVYAASYAASVYAASYAASYAAHSASYAAYAADAASYAANANSTDYYKPLLLRLIQTRLTEFERIMIL